MIRATSVVKNTFFILLLMLIIFCLFSCKGGKQATSAPTKVQAIRIKTEEIPIYLDYIGLTNAINTVTIRARVKGFLTEINFVEGSFVKKGDPLFVIDPREYRAQLDQAKADLEYSIANRAFQKVEYERMKRLVVTGAVSKEKFDSTKAKYEEAIAEVNINKAKVEEAALNLSYCYMYSPIDGKIGQRFVDVGNLVGGTTDTALATIVQLTPIYVDFSPSVNDFSQIIKYRENSPYPVEITLPEIETLKFYGKVDLINNEADQSTSTILMRAIFENKDNLLLPNIYVNVRIFLGKDPAAILIPSKAILESQGVRYVYLVDQNNKVLRQSIKTTQVYKDQNVIKSGLKAGDIVIIDGLQKLQTGDSVSPDIINDEGKS